MEQKKKVLFVATVVKTHINTFHLPFLKMFKEYGWEVHVAAKMTLLMSHVLYQTVTGTLI